jgi:hypothetical protein
MSNDTLVAIFANHEQTERAIKDLAETKFDMRGLSIVGQGYHTEEKVVRATESNSGANAVLSGAAFGDCSSAVCS